MRDIDHRKVGSVRLHSINHGNTSHWTLPTRDARSSASERRLASAGDRLRLSRRTGWMVPTARDLTYSLSDQPGLSGRLVPHERSCRPSPRCAMVQR